MTDIALDMPDADPPEDPPEDSPEDRPANRLGGFDGLPESDSPTSPEDEGPQEDENQDIADEDIADEDIADEDIADEDGADEDVVDGTLGVSGPSTLFHDLYGDLKRMAAYFMNRQSPNHTLAATDLLGEAYLKLAKLHRGRWNSKQHFMSEAAKTMRCVLVDHARAKGRDKRKAPGRRLALEGLMEQVERHIVDILDYHAAVEELESQGKRGALLARIADMILIAGMRIEEISAVMSLTVRTTERRWHDARAFLRSRLS